MRIMVQIIGWIMMDYSADYSADYGANYIADYDRL